MKIVINVVLAVYAVLIWVLFATNVGGIGAYLIYFHPYLKKMFTGEKTIY